MAVVDTKSTSPPLMIGKIRLVSILNRRNSTNALYYSRKTVNVRSAENPVDASPFHGTSSILLNSNGLQKTHTLNIAHRQKYTEVFAANVGAHLYGVMPILSTSLLEVSMRRF